MFCPECGTKNDEDALFCSECGTSLSEYREERGPDQSDVIDFGQMYHNPEQVQGQNPYEPGDDHMTDFPHRRKVSKAVIAAVVEGVLAVCLLAGTYLVLDKKFSPETVAMDYWEATMAQEWSKAYDYCDFPENDFLNKQMYVNVNSRNKERVSYNSSRIRRDGLAEGPDTRNYTVEYLTKGSSEKEYSYLTLARTGKKKFLFWNEWKVTSSQSWCRDVEFTVPADGTLYLNGVEVKEERSSSDVDTYLSGVTIPYLFLGSYQMEVKADGMEPYRKVIEIDDYGYHGSYIELVPSGETMEDLVEQMGNDIKVILESALAGKDFSEVEGYFTESAVKDGYVKSDYESISELTGDGLDTGIVSLQINKIQASVDSVHEGRYVQLTASMDIDETYHEYWGDGIESYKETIKFYPYYQKVGEDWKLTELPLSYYQFRR